MDVHSHALLFASSVYVKSLFFNLNRYFEVCKRFIRKKKFYRFSSESYAKKFEYWLACTPAVKYKVFSLKVTDRLSQ